MNIVLKSIRMNARNCLHDLGEVFFQPTEFINRQATSSSCISIDALTTYPVLEMFPVQIHDQIHPNSGCEAGPPCQIRVVSRRPGRPTIRGALYQPFVRLQGICHHEGVRLGSEIGLSTCVFPHFLPFVYLRIVDSFGGFRKSSED